MYVRAGSHSRRLATLKSGKDEEGGKEGRGGRLGLTLTALLTTVLMDGDREGKNWYYF